MFHRGFTAIAGALVTLALSLTPVWAAENGFMEISRERSAQYDGTVITMRHEPTGASLVYIDTNDSERAFGVGFRTPATDDTGVSHILEHSLLNGSTRPGCKPFTYLMNHSGATFLNAMTFSDFTYYALASRDEAEYRKLIANYLDGVFFPIAMRDEAVFHQEGWRKDGGDWNGTVFNEMKGVYSNDEEYLNRAVMRSLFPETGYQYDSGGDPNYIPTLSYENFQKAYERFYTPENALFVLYGHQDAGKTLALIEENYLNVLPENADKPEPPEIGKQAPLSHPACVSATYPAPAGRSSLAQSYVVCDRSDPVLTVQMEMLASLLADRSAAAFNDVVAAKLAEHVRVDYDNMMEQCVLSITADGIDPSKTDETSAAIDACLARAASEGFGKGRLKALKHRCAFQIASAKNQPHRGVDAGIEAMGAFVYGTALDDAAYERAVDQTDEGFLKEAVLSRMMDNPHRSLVVLTPSGYKPPVAEEPAQPEEEPAADAFAQALAQDGTVKKFPAESSQTEPQFTPPDYTVEEMDGAKLIHTKAKTHGTAAIHMYLDASTVPQPLLGYVQILAHTMADPASLPEDLLIGGAQGYMSADKLYGQDKFTPYMHLIFQGLDSDVRSMGKVAQELLNPDETPDETIVRNYLILTKLMMDDDYENQMPLADCRARISSAGRFNYQIDGPGYYAFVTGLLSDFDHAWPMIQENMLSAKKLLLNRAAVISFTGSDSAYRKFEKQAKPLAALFAGNTSPTLVAYDFPEPAISVYPAPLSQTRAVVQAGKLDKAGAEYNGAFLVAASLLNYDYLWPRIRDDGGAYGINVNILPDGEVLLRSYRDPNREATLAVYAGIPDFLKQPVSREDFLGVRAHVLANWEEQYQPYRLWDYGAKVELGLIDPEAIERTRMEILCSEPEDLPFDADIWE